MNYRTDLALEKKELIGDSVPDGVDFDEQINGKIKITRIKINTEDASKKLSKPCGNYITLEIPSPNADINSCKEEIEAIGEEIKKLITKEGTVLVVGLGNEDITPDAVGPKTAKWTIATRHITDTMPDINFRPVATINTGVMGQTGIETNQIVKAVCDKISPSCVIVIDALASMSTKRLGTTVQICDSGISPGSGVGNKRAELSEKTIGVPTIAVGVPTVVDAFTIASDLADENVRDKTENNRLENFMVTPREIDSLVTAVSRMLSLAIGRALQPDISVNDLYFLSV